MSPQTFVEVTLWLAVQLDGGSNIRSDLGDEAELRRLGESLKKRQDYPLLILADGTVVDGHRRLAAARLVGLTQLACIVIPPDTSPAELRLIQWRCAVHRKGISAYDTAVTIRDTKAEFPGITNKALAEDILDIDQSSVTQYLSIFSTLPEVQDAARTGRIGLMAWYDISKRDDQARALADALSDSSHPARDRNGKGNGHGKDAARPARIHIPLAKDDASGKVCLAGESLDSLEAAAALLEEAVKSAPLPRIKATRAADGGINVTVSEDEEAEETKSLLRAALASVRDAIKSNVSLRTAQAAWRDQANGK